MVWWLDADDEDELLARWVREREKLQRYVNAYKDQPQLAQNLSAWADHAPMLPRTILMAFAKANVSPTSRLGQWAIKNALVALQQRDLGFRTSGEALIKQSDDVLTFLGDPARVGELAKVPWWQQGRFEFTDATELAGLDIEGLQRFRHGQDTTPEPGGYGLNPLRSARRLVHDIGDVVTTGTRYAFGGLQSGYESLQAVHRASEKMTWDPLDTGRPFDNPFLPGDQSRNVRYGSWEEVRNPQQITLYNMIRGEESGSGFFPSGQALRTQQEASRAAASVLLPSGERSALTPGRAFAANVVEPGSREYNLVSGLVDFGVALKLDPADAVLRGVSNVRRARGLFTPEAAGAYTGLRKWVHGPTFEQWMDSAAGQRVVQKISEIGDIRTLRRQLGKNFPAELLPALQDANDYLEVRKLLREAVNGGLVRNTLEWGIDWKRPIQNVRWFSKMPTGALDPDDVGHNLEQVERYLVTAKVPDAEIERLMSRVARVNGYDELADFVFHDMTDVVVRNAIAEYGLSEQAAKQLFRSFKKDWDTQRQMAIDAMGDPLTIEGGAVLGGDVVRIEGPFQEVELLQRAVPLPDAREIRRKISKLRPLMDNRGVRILEGAGDWFMQDVWKPAALLRGAWTVRVVGEEQVRMAAAGLDSLFRHPISYLAYVLRKKGNYDILGKSFTDIAADAKAFDDPFVDALAKRGQASLTSVGRNNERVFMTGWTNWTRGSSGYRTAWADRLTEQALSPTGREVARSVKATGSLDEVKDMFWEGSLANIRERMARAKLWGGKSEVLLTTREGSDAYIDAVWRRIQALTGDDPELLDVIADGKWIKKSGAVDNALHAKLEAMEAAEAGPLKVNGPEMHTLGKGAHLDRAVQWAFNALMTAPTNTLSRSVAFKQNYWRHIEDLLPYMDEAAQDGVLRVARNSGVKLTKPRAAGALDLATADEIAKGKSLNDVRRLLYDVSEQSHSWDALRLVFPFGEAWKEVLTRWAILAWEEPHVIRRAQQGIQGARGSGFFYTDPDDGQEYFTFPFSEFLTRRVTGAPFPMRGTVSGLNIIGQGLPGVGPVVQIPVSHLIPEDRTWDWVREFISPFGDPEIDAGFFEAFLPGWAQRFRAATWLASPGQERIFENAVKDAMTYLASTGSYDLSSPDGLSTLESDARDMAKRVYFWRGVVQFVAPTAPQMVPQMRGKDGKLYEILTVAKDYQRLRDKHDGDWAEATIEFIERYGDTAYMALEPRAEREIYGVPTTRQAELWRAEHKNFVENAPTTYGYFAPQGGDFDYSAYERAIERGEIRPVDADEWVRLANDRVASAIYARFRRQVGPNPAPNQLAWLDEKKAQLAEEFEGYDPWKIGGKTAKSRKAQIEELRKAIQHRDVKDTRLAEAIGLYLTFRDRAVQQAGTVKKRDVMNAAEPLNGKKVAHLRAWLREKGDQIVREYPEFQAVYDGVFFGEIDFTQEELEEAAA